MTKAVLMSINPKWCRLIENGEKTVEIRKTRPKIEPPFKVYIYQTLPKSGDINDKDGRVIGEFWCNEIQEVYQCNSGWVNEYACMSSYDFFDYLGLPYDTHFGYDKKAFAWHISDLMIYNKPKNLNIWGVKKAPQSWRYVEEINAVTEVCI